MRIAIPGLILLALAAVALTPRTGAAQAPAGQEPAAAEAPAKKAEKRARPRRDLISQEEIQKAKYGNAYEVVRALRPRWLQTRDSNSLMGKRAVVQAHMDEVRLGGVEALKAIPVSNIVYIRWYDGQDASGRWGLDHGQGAIVVSSHPEE
jgi:hypothetical protein